MKVALIGMLMAAELMLSPSAKADEVGGTTSCSVVVQAFKDKNHEIVRQSHLYIQTVMDSIDLRHADAGEPAFMSELSDDDREVMTALAVDVCERHPKMMLRAAAAEAYDGARSLGKALAE